MKKSIGLAIFVAALFVLTHISAAANCTKTKTADVVEQLFAAWNSHNANMVADCFSETAVYEDVAAGEIHRGRDAIRKWAASAFVDIDNFKIEVLSNSVKDGRGLVEWKWSGTDKGLMKTGKRFSVRGVSVIEVRRGKITNYKEYYDFATVMRQLGVMPGGENK